MGNLNMNDESLIDTKNDRTITCGHPYRVRRT